MAFIEMDFASGGSTSVEYSDYTIGTNNRFVIARIGKYRCICVNPASPYQMIDNFVTFTLDSKDIPKTSFGAYGLIYNSTNSILFSFSTDGTVTTNASSTAVYSTPPCVVWEVN